MKHVSMNTACLRQISPEATPEMRIMSTLFIKEEEGKRKRMGERMIISDNCLKLKSAVCLRTVLSGERASHHDIMC